MSAAPCAAKRVRNRSSGYVAAVAMAPAVPPAIRGIMACWNVLGGIVVADLVPVGELDG